MGRRWGLFATIWLLILTSVYLADRFVRDVFLTDDTPRAVTVGCGEGQEMYGVELYVAWIELHADDVYSPIVARRDQAHRAWRHARRPTTIADRRRPW